MSVRLEWDGKPTQVERLSLPFQTVETINESRATRERDEGSLFGSGEKGATWRNQLIWGDNKLVMSSLLKEFAGQIKLIYIDPPFDTGTDFSFRVELGDADVTKLPSVLEEHAYRDTWGGGRGSYLSMIYERLSLSHELLANDGSIFVHAGPNVSHVIRSLLDEIFGTANFRNEIIWKRTSSHNDAKRFGEVHDSLIYFAKSETYVWHPQHTEHSDEYLNSHYGRADEQGRHYRLDNIIRSASMGARPNLAYEYNGFTPQWGWRVSRERLEAIDAAGRLTWSSSGTPYLIRYLDEQQGAAVASVWDDVPPVNSQAKERVNYPTQKPERLLERLIAACSDENDLVADFFAGSGTTAVVAEKMGRRWIATDLGRFAIHTTRKRLLNIPDCRPFEIRNLGSYERQHWRQDTGNGALRGYLDTILAFYRAEPVEGFQHLHGRKAGRMVHVGATDAPITIDEAEEVMDELADNGIESCDLLGWEWEMGLHDTIGERARRRGLDVRVLQIPREVMERRVQEADACASSSSRTSTST